MKVKTYSDFVSFAEPDDLGNAYFFEQGLNDTDIARITDHSRNTSINELLHRSHVSRLSLDNDTEWLYKKVGDMAAKANEILWDFSLAGMSEALQLEEYSASDEDNSHWHFDMGRGPSARRKISVVIQLTDPAEYTGGDLQLQLDGESHSIKKGKGYVCLFPSYLVHRVTPVTKGNPQFLVLWVSGAPFR